MTGAQVSRVQGGQPTPEEVAADAADADVDWRPLAVILTGTFLIVLDFFIVNVALPSIQRNLHTSPAALEWVVAGYGLSFAVLIITGGRLGDRLGRRYTFAVGIAVFAAASLACGVAPNASSLIAARVVQGVGAALISPNVLSIIGVLYTGTNRVKAITAYGLVMGLAAAGGQIVGGLLIEANVAGSAWRTIFLINVPVGLAALMLARHIVPESRADIPKQLDLGGIALATLTLTAIILPLVEGRQLGWPTWTWASLAASPFVFLALARYQQSLVRHGREPLLHPTVFRDPLLRAGLTIQALCWCSQASFFLVLALYLQNGRHQSPLRSGLMFSTLAAGFVIVSRRAPSLTARFGRNLIMAGALTVGIGNLALIASIQLGGASASLGLLAPGLILVGAGQGMWITPLTATVLSFADPQRAGMVSGTLSTMQQIGNSLGVALIGIVFFNALHHSYRTAFTHALIALTAGLTAAAALTRLLRPTPPPKVGVRSTAGRFGG